MDSVIGSDGMMIKEGKCMGFYGNKKRTACAESLVCNNPWFAIPNKKNIVPTIFADGMCLMAMCY